MQLQLDDLKELSNMNGKANVWDNREMGQTVAYAVRTDAQAIQSALAEELQASEDRPMALDASGVPAPARLQEMISEGKAADGSLPEDVSATQEMGDQKDANDDEIARLEKMSSVHLSDIRMSDREDDNDDGMDNDLLDLQSSVYMSSLHTGDKENANKKYMDEKMNENDIRNKRTNNNTCLGMSSASISSASMTAERTTNII
ncbi:hypothetical protein N0V82_008463 [Gnomoniopsis sp. IMI 355080]|nr:hypothetical protein N0V82_008463 [Gnomoniopsis sp. IMI 355080]